MAAALGREGGAEAVDLLAPARLVVQHHALDGRGRPSVPLGHGLALLEGVAAAVIAQRREGRKVVARPAAERRYLAHAGQAHERVHVRAEPGVLAAEEGARDLHRAGHHVDARVAAPRLRVREGRH